MLRLHQIRLSLADAAYCDDALYQSLAARRLRLSPADIAQAAVSRRSVDARSRDDVCFMLTLDVRLAAPKTEQALAAKFAPNEVAYVPDSSARRQDVFTMPVAPYPKDRPRPVVIGAGPAGLFCALMLAARGARPLVLERGKPVEERVKDVQAMEVGGVLDPESNVLFGEGGAGTFSDGKLTCGLGDPLIGAVLQTLVACGAPEDILIAAKPHIGTDLLRGVLQNARKRLRALGGEMLFSHKAVGWKMQNGRISGVTALAGVNGTPMTFDTDAVYLAIGHSARDTYRLLREQGVPMAQKPFAVGVRIEHPQLLIDRAQYGRMAGSAGLPPAAYKLNVLTPDSRGAYTFCMCPGGQVMNASSEPGMLNVNGMSLHARNAENANAALLVGVKPADFGADDPLAGIELQRRIERAAFQLGGGYCAPCQRVDDFLHKRPSKGLGSVRPSYKPGVFAGDIAECLPPFIADNLCFALPKLGQRLRGFDWPDALLTAPETRTSSPVRLLRDERGQSAVGGLYPLGEGAGYAGGIVSAAVDGLRAALEA
jgi:uncharacterized FAD-dependent dehydrogenase